MNKKGILEISIGTIVIGVLAMIMLIFGLIAIMNITNNLKCKNCYLTSDEALSSEFSGDILNDLEFCNINIIDENAHLLVSFSFLGINSKPNYECRNLKEKCEQSEICYWMINKGATHSNNEKYWHSEFIGTCVCKLLGGKDE